MRVIEIFSSIQGEGYNLGLPVVFVRFAGCNLRCSFCDTKESWLTDYTDMTIPQIVDTCLKQGPKTVVLTGGEPCIHPEINDLALSLKEQGFTVCVETNGTMPVPKSIDWVTCSPKADAHYMIHPDCKANELKYVVTPDFNADEIISEDIRNKFSECIWLQPEGGDMSNMWKKAYEIAMNDSRLRVGVQLHKIVEVK